MPTPICRKYLEIVANRIKKAADIFLAQNSKGKIYVDVSKMKLLGLPTGKKGPRSAATLLETIKLKYQAPSDPGKGPIPTTGNQTTAG